ncbi:glycosyl hydrolase family 61-domain-containing protein [Crepidotus variabilis]|uniref:AA9 family lytic polysaccharide monooxygenase n=1 Tax=Crepidotus variabilis TaxID=179855 RepID=A0A9P6EMT1_9AGAR|nr:glycosyl hydrolase family 61-domain-containing protein [Crepidotus variabilis]
MQLKAFVVLASVLSTALAHTRVWSVWINGVDQGDGKGQYIRSPPTNNPVKDITSSAMSCNVNNQAVPKVVSVRAGDTVTFEWFHDYRNDDIIATSHKGPVLVYIAPTSSNGAGSVWTKLFHAGNDGSWAVDKLLNSKGHHNVVIPDVPAGDYLLRPEIIALHEANVPYSSNNIRGAQLYMNCIQIKVTSNGSKTLPSGNSFPGTYSYSNPGIVFDIYAKGADMTKYQVPGPSVWSGSSGGAITRAAIVTNPTPPSGGGSTPAPGNGQTAALYGQCGGTGWTGPTLCAEGVCKAASEYYSQCVPA